MSEAKQVILVRTDLNMRKGKIAVQVAHASMKVFLGSGDFGFTWQSGARGLVFEGVDEEGNSGDPAFLVHLTSAMAEWLGGAFPKVCVQVGSEAELLTLYGRARDQGLPCALVTDQGRTEFHGVPTNTCVAIGPAPGEDVDRITRHLKLL